MAMFYGAQLQAMLPKLHSSNFEGMELIRPMYCIHEEDIIRWKNNPDIEKSVFNSIHSVCLDTMPGWKTKGETHSFLEHYDRE